MLLEYNVIKFSTKYIFGWTQMTPDADEEYNRLNYYLLSILTIHSRIMKSTYSLLCYTYCDVSYS